MTNEPDRLGPDFWSRRPLIGMVHLQALPGSPRDAGRGLDAAIDQAIYDARALELGGADALIVENFWDSPFATGSVPIHTISAMTLAIKAVRDAASLPVGVNVLRNDACAAVGIAHVCQAHFVRINVYVGAAITDQGLIQGAARDAVLYRKELGASVQIWADVFVKHAAQLGNGSLADSARDAVHRGLADALIVSGVSTGSETHPDDIRQVKTAVPDTPVLIGSGLTARNAQELMETADGAIAGTSLKKDGMISQPVDPGRVHALRQAMRR